MFNESREERRIDIFVSFFTSVLTFFPHTNGKRSRLVGCVVIASSSSLAHLFFSTSCPTTITANITSLSCYIRVIRCCLMIYSSNYRVFNETNSLIRWVHHVTWVTNKIKKKKKMKNERKSIYEICCGSNIQRNNVVIIFPLFSLTFNIFEPFLSAHMI